MAPRGPKPKPTHLKVLEGNPGKRPLPQNEPMPVPVAPKPPAWLDPIAKKLWKHLAPQLEVLGLLTAVDGAAFEAACQNYAVWVKCEKYLKENGLTVEIKKTNGTGEEYTSYVQQRPEVSIGNKALQAFKAFCAEFGLTPASRTRIDIKPPDAEEDPMEALLRKNGGG